MSAERKFGADRISESAAIDIIAQRSALDKEGAASELARACQNDALRSWGIPWNPHSGRDLAESHAQMLPDAWKDPEYAEGQIQLSRCWSDGVLRASPWRDREYAAADIDRVWRPATAPPKPAPSVRPVDIVEQLASYLRQHPGMKEPEARAAAENDKGLLSSKREWWAARRKVADDLKLSKGRPKQ